MPLTRSSALEFVDDYTRAEFTTGRASWGGIISSHQTPTHARRTGGVGLPSRRGDVWFRRSAKSRKHRSRAASRSRSKAWELGLEDQHFYFYIPDTRRRVAEVERGRHRRGAAST